jgi:hypothetical protein
MQTSQKPLNATHGLERIERHQAISIAQNKSPPEPRISTMLFHVYLQQSSLALFPFTATKILSSSHHS